MKMETKTDWSLLFTQAFRGENIEAVINELFKNGDIILNREQFEALIVKLSTILIEKVEKKRGPLI